MERFNLVRIGRVQKTFGTSGELILDTFETELTLDIGVPVFLELMGTRVPFLLSHIKDRPDGRYQIKLEDVEDPDDALKLVNSRAYLERQYLPSPPEGEMFATDLIGYLVSDNNKGELGRVKDILEYPEQDMLEVISEGKSILLPLIREFVIEIDPDQKMIILDTPEGLLDILQDQGDGGTER